MGKFGEATSPVFDEKATRLVEEEEEKCNRTDACEIMDECILKVGMCSGQTFIDTFQKNGEYCANIYEKEQACGGLGDFRNYLTNRDPMMGDRTGCTASGDIWYSGCWGFPDQPKKKLAMPSVGD